MSRNHAESDDEASMDSTAHSGLTKEADWQEDVYQKVKAMKETYFPDLNEMHQRVSLKLQHQDSTLELSKEQIERLEMMKAFIERVLTFLQMPKACMPIGLRDKMSGYEKQIISFLNANRGGRIIIPSHQGHQQLQPNMNSHQMNNSVLQQQHLKQQQDQQLIQSQQLKHQLLQQQQLNPQLHLLQQQQLWQQAGRLNSLQSSSVLGRQGIVTGPLQQGIMGSQQQNSMDASEVTGQFLDTQVELQNLRCENARLRLSEAALQARVKDHEEHEARFQFAIENLSAELEKKTEGNIHEMVKHLIGCSPSQLR